MALPCTKEIRFMSRQVLKASGAISAKVVCSECGEKKKKKKKIGKCKNFWCFHGGYGTAVLLESPEVCKSIPLCYLLYF